MSEVEKTNLENCQEYDIIRSKNEVCMITNLEDQIQSFFLLSSVNLANHLRDYLKIDNPTRDRDINYEEWFKKGKECELLQEGKKWQQGKLRIKLTLEFIPDESQVSEENGHQEVENITESPLDEIRQQLTEESKY